LSSCFPKWLDHFAFLWEGYVNLNGFSASLPEFVIQGFLLLLLAFVIGDNGVTFWFWFPKYSLFISLLAPLCHSEVSAQISPQAFKIMCIFILLTSKVLFIYLICKYFLPNSDSYFYSSYSIFQRESFFILVNYNYQFFISWIMIFGVMLRKFKLVKISFYISSESFYSFKCHTDVYYQFWVNLYMLWDKDLALFFPYAYLIQYHLFEILYCLCSFNKNQSRVGGMAQVVEHLPKKCEALVPHINKQKHLT
jgi:hypothetical protein